MRADHVPAPKSATGQLRPNVLGSSAGGSLRFLEKQAFAATIDDAFLEGFMDPIPYSYCEVYPSMGIKTDACAAVCCGLMTRLQLRSRFKLRVADPVVVLGEVVSLVSAMQVNYFHWMTEGVARCVHLCMCRFASSSSTGYCTRTSTSKRSAVQFGCCCPARSALALTPCTDHVNTGRGPARVEHH